MVLSQYTIKNIQQQNTEVPDELLFDLPEKVLQFGTGVFLRGVPDYFIDRANRLGIFNGRIVAVQSTHTDKAAVFNKQDSLYTVCIRGTDKDKTIRENSINSSISRVLNAAVHWEQVLECAHNQALHIIISNTTETGIQLVNDDIRQHPPVSFPGKLLAFLYERFHAFGGSEKSGMVIVPTEMIPENGKKLESIVLELAHLNGLEEEFMEWLENHNSFCNSVADGMVVAAQSNVITSLPEDALEYTDQLAVVSEPFSFWFIEANEAIKNRLSFAQASQQILIEGNIKKNRNIQASLMQQTLTLSCGLAILAGFDTVKQAMDDETMAAFITELLTAGLLPASNLHTNKQKEIQHLLNRLRNPFLSLYWKDVALQYSAKMKTHGLSALVAQQQYKHVHPELFALAFAGYLFFTRPVKKVNNQFYGELNGKEYEIEDEMAETIMKRWNNFATEKVVREVLVDVNLWDDDLTAIPGFSVSVLESLDLIQAIGVNKAIKTIQSKKVLV